MLIYIPNEDGEILVIKAGKTLEVVARSQLPAAGEELFRASLAVSDGRLYCRSTRALYCLGKAGAE